MSIDVYTSIFSLSLYLSVSLSLRLSCAQSPSNNNLAFPLSHLPFSLLSLPLSLFVFLSLSLSLSISVSLSRSHTLYEPIFFCPFSSHTNYKTDRVDWHVEDVYASSCSFESRGVSVVCVRAFQYD